MCHIFYLNGKDISYKSPEHIVQFSGIILVEYDYNVFNQSYEIKKTVDQVWAHKITSSALELVKAMSYDMLPETTPSAVVQKCVEFRNTERHKLVPYLPNSFLKKSNE